MGVHAKNSENRWVSMVAELMIQLEIVAPLEQTLDVAEQKINVETALVGFVDDDRVVGTQFPIGLNLRQQHAVGQHLEETVLPDPRIETQLITDPVPQLRAEFTGDARSGAARRHPARLCVSDESGGATAGLQADLRKLCGFPRAGFAANDDHGTGVDGPLDFGNPVR